MGNGSSDIPDMTRFYWVKSSVDEPAPINAVLAGTDSDGSSIYIGRAVYRGDTLPAHVNPSKEFACVSWGGKQVSVSSYEILVRKRFKWVSCYGDNIPRGAAPAGVTCCEEILYVGRVKYAGRLRIGKVNGSRGFLYIGYKGNEIKFGRYEILVYR